MTPTDEEFASARRKVDAGKLNWKEAAAEIGTTAYTLRYRTDAVFRSREKKRNITRDRGTYEHENRVDRRPPQEDIERALASIPPDTRTRTGRALGDPLPGRSALDKMRARK